MNETAHRVRFERHPDGVRGVVRTTALDAVGRPVPGPRVALVGRQHGNEPVGEAVIERLERVLADHLVAGTVTMVLANLDAAALDLRQTPEGVNMNRLWDADRLAHIATAPRDTLVSEELRVREIAPFVVGSDVILDLHSTSRPSPPHLLFRDDLRHAEIAAQLGVTRLVTGVHEGGILDGGLCADAGLRAGEPSDWVGFTLEAGQHDNPENLDRAWEVVVRLLTVLEMWRDADGVSLTPVAYEVYDIVDRFRQAPAGAPQYRFVGFEGGEPGADRHGPPRKLESFEHIESDEVVLRRRGGEVVRAEAPFTMLMPAPTAEPGEDLYYVCQRRHAALATRPRTAEAARAEALAIERMLDLLTWDEANRGVTVVTTTSRRTLDLCADILARTTRLPAGHPHRRVTIVGRGDGGDDEHEQRAAARWHRALDEALEAGVPIERIQLLRGTNLGWIRRLGASCASNDGALELYLAHRQPHSVSVVIVGDPERARASGQYRHVAVGLLVEAATVDPDGDDVRIRVARTGTFGSRPELVRTAQGLVASLREEHRVALADLPDSLVAHTDGGGPLRLSRDPVGIADALVAWRLQRWSARLRMAVPKPLTLPRGGLGAWLARTIVATGILDPHTLRAWIVRPTDGGWHVDPDLIDIPPGPDDVVGGSKIVPADLIQARDADADNIERWVGWKRYLREAQALPGDRGRNLDVTFRGAAIQRRVARWMDEARALAAEQPGRWLVAITGDGLSPRREGEAEGWDVLWAHRRIVLDPHLRYLRVQHAQGTHLAWMKDLVTDLASRPPDAVPAAMGWETEHGGSVNVMLVARLRDGHEPTPWSLEAWRVERCAVLVASGSGGQAYQIALFTEPDDTGAFHAELAHFGRTHVERVLRQSTWRYHGSGGPRSRLALEQAVLKVTAELAQQLVKIEDLLRETPEGERARVAADRLGLLDVAIADQLQHAVLEGVDPLEAARRLWTRTEAWPGKLWGELGEFG